MWKYIATFEKEKKQDKYISEYHKKFLWSIKYWFCQESEYITFEVIMELGKNTKYIKHSKLHIDLFDIYNVIVLNTHFIKCATSYKSKNLD